MSTTQTTESEKWRSPYSTTNSHQEREAAAVRSVWARDVNDEYDDDEEYESSPRVWIGVGRGAALMLGTLLLVDLFAPGGLSPAGPWWLPIAPLPQHVGVGLLGACAGSFLLFAVRGSLPTGIRAIASLCAVAVLLLAIKDATIYYGLLKRGDLAAGPSVPIALHIAACAAVILLAMRKAEGSSGLLGTFFTFVGCAATAISLPLAHMFCDGPIDARQSAVTAIVASPRVSEPNREQRLKERLELSLALHKEGLIPGIVLTGSDDAEVLETMRQAAISLGWKAEQIETIAKGDYAAVYEKLAPRYSGVNGDPPVALVLSSSDHLPRLILEGNGLPLTLAGVPSNSLSRPDTNVLVDEMSKLWRLYLRQ